MGHILTTTETKGKEKCTSQIRGIGEELGSFRILQEDPFPEDVKMA